MSSIIYKVNEADNLSIEKHLFICSNSFIPPLETYVDIHEYAIKLANNAITFEAWYHNELISFIACYLNDKINCQGFISNISTIPSFQGKGVSSILLQNLINFAKKGGFNYLVLEVKKLNNKAISFYNKKGFKIDEKLSTTDTYNMYYVIV